MYAISILAPTQAQEVFIIARFARYGSSFPTAPALQSIDMQIEVVVVRCNFCSRITDQ